DIRIFVGSAPNGEDAESLMVLEYSLRNVTSWPVDITYMQLSKDPSSPWYSEDGEGWNTSLWPTPFSGFRWAIPWACGYEGKAIYMDSDVIVLQDLQDLWQTNFTQSTVVAAKSPARFCVCVWDNEAIGTMVKNGELPDLCTSRGDADYHSKM